jgi:hypothetical protein
MKSAVLIFVCIFTIQFQLSAQMNREHDYARIMCYILHDTCVVSKLNLITNSSSLVKWEEYVSISKYLLPFSTFPFHYFDKVFNASEIAELNDPLKSSEDSINVNKIGSGQNIRSPFKIFFSDFKQGLVTVDIGYSELTGNSYSRDAYFFPTFLSVLYKIDKKSIHNVETVLVHN